MIYLLNNCAHQRLVLAFPFLWTGLQKRGDHKMERRWQVESVDARPLESVVHVTGKEGVFRERVTVYSRFWETFSLNLALIGSRLKRKDGHDCPIYMFAKMKKRSRKWCTGRVEHGSSSSSWWIDTGGHRRWVPPLLLTFCVTVGRGIIGTLPSTW